MKKCYFKASKLIKGALACAMLIGICIPINAFASDFETTVQSDEFGFPIATSIEMDNAGEVLQTGDVIGFSLKIDEQNPNYIMKLELSSPISSDLTQDVELQYEKETNTYKGSFEVSDSTYASEWYVNQILMKESSEDLYWQVLNTSYDFALDSYFYVESNGKYEIPNYETVISFAYINEQGEVEFYYPLGDKKIIIPRRTTLRDLGIEIPKSIPDGYEELLLLNWEDRDGINISDSRPILSDYDYDNMFYANYDKEAALIHYRYPDKDQLLQTDSKVILVNKGTTYGDVWEEKMDYRPKEIYSEATFDYWDGYDWVQDEEIKWKEEPSIIDEYHLEFDAYFKDKNVALIMQSYYDLEGKWVTSYGARVIDKGITYNEIEEYEIQQPSPSNGFVGLRFSNWICNMNGILDEPDDIFNGNYLVAIRKNAEYENCLVSFAIDEAFRFIFESDSGQGQTRSTGVELFSPGDIDAEYFCAYAVEKGEQITIQIPHEYENVKYCHYNTALILANGTVIRQGDIYEEGDKVTISEDARFVGSANLPISEDPSMLSEAEITKILDSISSSESGAEIQIEMDDAFILPAEILKAAAEKGVDLLVNMENYEWLIDGDTIENVSDDVNFKMTLNTDNVPSDLIEEVADGNTVMQFALEHDGEFGFDARFTFDVGEENAGKNGDLYYFNGEELLFQDSNIVEKDGMISFKFTHASDYVVVLTEQKAATTTELEKMLEKAQGYLEGNYTLESKDVLQNAINNAQLIIEKEDVTTEEVRGAIEKLSDAISKLIVEASVDKDALAHEIMLAQEMIDHIEDYVPSSVTGLSDKLEVAQQVYDDETAVQEEVDAATKTIREARLNARTRADISALRDLINYVNKLNLNVYDLNDVKALKQLLNEGMELVNDPEVTQSDADEQVQKIQTMIKKMQSACDSGENENSSSDRESSESPETAAYGIAGFALILIFSAMAGLTIMNRRKAN